MITVSKHTLYPTVLLGIVSLGTVSVGFSETIVTELTAPVAVILALLIPGLASYLIITQRNTVDSNTVIYGMGLSASLLMLFGFLINIGYQLFGIEMLRPVPTWIAFGLLLGGLGLGIERRVPGDSIRFALPTAVQPYLFSAIPVVAGVGAIIVEQGGTNRFVLLALGGILLIYCVGAFDPSRRATLVYCIALGLLLHNTLISELLVWGDQGKEAFLAQKVIDIGHWNPAVIPRANKAIMLRLVILHPLHMMLTGLGVLHVFKIVHPVLFAIAPVALYQTFAARDNPRAGYLGAGSLMFFFSFFTVLSRNTRTAGAILFLILFVRTLLDADLPMRVRRVFLPLFGASLFVSHYGTGYMFLTILIGGFVVALGGRLFPGPHRDANHTLPTHSVFLTVLMGYAWYSYAPPGSATLGTLVSFVIDFSEKLQDGFFQPTNSATAHYASGSYTSPSLVGIKILTIVLFGLIGLGWVVMVIRLLRGKDGIGTTLPFVGISAVAGSLAGVTFLPVERFNTARTVAIVLAVVGPLFPMSLTGVKNVVSMIRRVPDRVSTAGGLVVLVAFFLCTSGLLAATVTHEYSPNVLVYQEEVLTDGPSEAKTYLYKQHIPDTEMYAARWLAHHGRGTIYGGSWPGNPVTGRRTKVHTNYTYDGDILAASSRGCIYLDPVSVRGGVIRLPAGHLKSSFMQTSDLNTTGRSRVFTNSGATVYC